MVEPFISFDECSKMLLCQSSRLMGSKIIEAAVPDGFCVEAHLAVDGVLIAASLWA